MTLIFIASSGKACCVKNNTLGYFCL